MLKFNSTLAATVILFAGLPLRAEEARTQITAVHGYQTSTAGFRGDTGFAKTQNGNGRAQAIAGAITRDGIHFSRTRTIKSDQNRTIGVTYSLRIPFGGQRQESLSSAEVSGRDSYLRIGSSASNKSVGSWVEARVPDSHSARATSRSRNVTRGLKTTEAIEVMRMIRRHLSTR